MLWIAMSRLSSVHVSPGFAVILVGVNAKSAITMVCAGALPTLLPPGTNGSCGSYLSQEPGAFGSHAVGTAAAMPAPPTVASAADRAAAVVSFAMRVGRIRTPNFYFLTVIVAVICWW